MMAVPVEAGLETLGKHVVRAGTRTMSKSDIRRAIPTRRKFPYHTRCFSIPLNDPFSAIDPIAHGLMGIWTMLTPNLEA